LSDIVNAAGLGADEHAITNTMLIKSVRSIFFFPANANEDSHANVARVMQVCRPRVKHSQ
jgi:hypothetical protein